MKNEEQFMVDGFLFGNKDDVKQAQEEVETVKFLEQKMNFEDTGTTLRVYEKALKEKIFKTPIGFEFMRKIQHELMKRGVPEENIKPIPLYQVFSRTEEVKPARVQKKKVKPDKTKIYLRTSVLVNIALVILVIGMFVISLFGETPNIVNYRFRIQDEYSTWEQELTERENRIKEKERELNLE
ncbi:MAG: hypothetical protein IJP31_12165 [Lachnospiraceae bacterium]|nr:hypothetical protein [Lachnospiraceae bacterium]